MNAITINTKARTIDLSNTFAKAASLFGSEEYRQLQEARRDYPSYRVVTVKQKGTGKADFASLSFDFMDKYIANHDVSDDLKAEYLPSLHAGRSPAMKWPATRPVTAKPSRGCWRGTSNNRNQRFQQE